MIAAQAAVPRAARARDQPDACQTCRHFAGSGDEIEQRLPGLRTLGSAYGSVRAADGLCRLHDRYLAAASHCAFYGARATAATLT